MLIVVVDAEAWLLWWLDRVVVSGGLRIVVERRLQRVQRHVVVAARTSFFGRYAEVLLLVVGGIGWRLPTTELHPVE